MRLVCPRVQIEPELSIACGVAGELLGHGITERGSSSKHGGGRTRHGSSRKRTSL